MKDFELKLGGTTYTCTSSQSNREGQNWHIRARFHDLRINMEIPCDSKVPLDKVLVFIASFDETLKKVQSDKAKELTFINQMT